MFCCGWVADLDVRANKPHASRHKGGAPDEHLGPSEAVDNEEHCDAHSNESNQAIDSCGVQSRTGALQADGFEDSGREEVDSVGAGHLHKDEDTNADGDSVAISLMRELFQLCEDAFAGCTLTLLFDLVHDAVYFFLEVGVIRFDVSQLREDTNCLLTASEPSVPSKALSE